MFQALNSSPQYPPTYTTAALGWYFDAASGKYYWVMDLGTLPDSGPGNLINAPRKKTAR
jgi:hypothetical protein